MREKSENTVSDKNGNDPFVSKNVVLCADGKYRWVYEMKLLKDFWVLGTILKIFGGIIGAGAVIFLIVELFGNHDYLGVLKMVGIMSAILLGLSVIGYLVKRRSWVAPTALSIRWMTREFCRSSR